MSPKHLSSCHLLLPACQNQSKKDVFKALSMYQDQPTLLKAFEICCAQNFDWGVSMIIKSGHIVWKDEEGQKIMGLLVRRFLQQGKDELVSLFSAFHSLPTHEQKDLPRLLMVSVNMINVWSLKTTGSAVSKEQQCLDNVFRVFLHPGWTEHRLARTTPEFFQLLFAPQKGTNSEKTKEKWEAVKPALLPAEVLGALIFLNKKYRHVLIGSSSESTNTSIRQWEEALLEKPMWWYQELQRLWNDVDEQTQQHVLEKAPSLKVQLEKVYLTRTIETPSRSTSLRKM